MTDRIDFGVLYGQKTTGDALLIYSERRCEGKSKEATSSSSLPRMRMARSS